MSGEMQTLRFPGALSVTELNEFIKSIMDRTPQLTDVYIKGEISNFKNHYSTGHYYFSLKDDGGVIRAVMFRASAAKLKFMPENGMCVVAHGRVSSFVRDGQYQLYADSMEPDGIGALYVAFEQLKNKLASEGLFSPERKRALPKIPSRVGIITSATGAAVRDMINISGRRFPAAKIILYPSLVQGPGAPQSLIKGIKYFNDTSGADVIIIGRGGGSIEDLWAFNDETLARCVAASEIPVISAVGHETDFTICDFAADQRAPTPSAAAELALPDTSELKRKITNLIDREAAVINQMINARYEKLSALSNSRVITNPMTSIEDREMLLVNTAERMIQSTKYNIDKKSMSFQNICGKLQALDPMSVISRGYSAVYNEGKLVKKIDDVKKGDVISFSLCDGEVEAVVEKTVKKDDI